MSRSRRKYAVEYICQGDNTPYYKQARRHLRSMNKQEMRHLTANYNPDVIDDLVMGFDNKHDIGYNDWNEPTDGHGIITDKNQWNYKKQLRK